MSYEVLYQCPTCGHDRAISNPRRLGTYIAMVVLMTVLIVGSMLATLPWQCSGLDCEFYIFLGGGFLILWWWILVTTAWPHHAYPITGARSSDEAAGGVRMGSILLSKDSVGEAPKGSVLQGFLRLVILLSIFFGGALVLGIINEVFF